LEKVQKLYTKIDPQNPMQGLIEEALNLLTSSLGCGNVGSTVNNLIQGGLNFFHK
jgi:hypothetical protein